MKITVVGMIKNSADIIETFIRANGIFADQFVLLNNDCTDRTIPILQQLIAEGYNIDIIDDNENAYMQSAKMNNLIKNVVEQYDTDWIVPLDDDEILVSNIDGLTVREEIETWDRNKAYYAKWRVYIPTSEDDINEICVIKRLNYIFADRIEGYRKIIFSREIAKNAEFKIMQGNHDFQGTNVVKIDQRTLSLAHYPVRSQEQIMSKALVGWTNNLAAPNNIEGNGGHWKEIYNSIKSSLEIKDSLMLGICMLYLVCKEDLKVDYKPIALKEEAFVIKYTGAHEINPLENYFNNTEKLALAYAKLLREKMEQ